MIESKSGTPKEPGRLFFYQGTFSEPLQEPKRNHFGSKEHIFLKRNLNGTLAGTKKDRQGTTKVPIRKGVEVRGIKKIFGMV